MTITRTWHYLELLLSHEATVTYSLCDRDRVVHEAETHFLWTNAELSAKVCHIFLVF